MQHSTAAAKLSTHSPMWFKAGTCTCTFSDCRVMVSEIKEVISAQLTKWEWEREAIGTNLRGLLGVDRLHKIDLHSVCACVVDTCKQSSVNAIIRKKLTKN